MILAKGASVHDHWVDAHGDGALYSIQYSIFNNDLSASCASTLGG